jgi:membrane-bound lytic murein transglycosylase D
MPGIKPLLASLLLTYGTLALADAQVPAQNTEPRNDVKKDSKSPQQADNAPSETALIDADLWQRIRKGFRIEAGAKLQPLIKVHESWYAARPENIHRTIERARPYLYHIASEVERRAMPMEIALLPFIESAFNPRAYSPAAASGIWQFIPSTGRNFGLKQDHWYDGRRDITAATQAALDYLGKLYLDFGDWQLALAAYNCGEGCVARAIQKNVAQGLPTDYASLALPAETRHYVPKLLAVKNLVLDPERYGIAIDILPDAPYFSQVTVRADLDVKSAARLAGMSVDEFTALNPAYSRNLIRSDTPVNILVPVGKTDRFASNLQNGVWDTWKPYGAKKGETPQAIAKRFGTTVARLEEHNAFKLRRGKLARAQTVLIPVKGRGVVLARSISEAPKAEPQPVVRELNLHNVAAGETLYSISRRYGLTVAELKDANPDLVEPIKTGQVLQLPADRTPPAAANAAPQPSQVAFTPTVRSKPAATHYTIRRGDTLFSIARRFDVSVADIRRWNPALRHQVHAGKRIVIQQPS